MPDQRRSRAARAVTVQRTEWLSDSMVRVVVGGRALADVDPSPFADCYVKVVHLHPDVPRPWTRTADDRVDVDAVSSHLGPEAAPRMRSYTVRRLDRAALEMTLDFVVHGGSGVAGPWAASASPGDELLFLGPGPGSYAPDPGAARHLLVGDASALPAIAVALERLPADARGDVVVEVGGRGDEIDLPGPDGVRLTWVHQQDAPVGAHLVTAVRELPWAHDDVQAFVHGEAGAVRELRRYLRTERGLDMGRLSVSGYWRVGVDDEGWRASKREWTAAVESDERAVAG